jgi:hypothetical protein
LATVNEQEFPTKFKAKETGCKIPGAPPPNRGRGDELLLHSCTFIILQKHIIYNVLGIILAAGNLAKKLCFCTRKGGEVFALRLKNRARGSCPLKQFY